MQWAVENKIKLAATGEIPKVSRGRVKLSGNLQIFLFFVSSGFFFARYFLI